MNAAKHSVETVPTDVAERVRAIRFRLPRQAVSERLEIARIAYGPLYTMGLIRERMTETLPIRVGLHPLGSHRAHGGVRWGDFRRGAPQVR